MFDISDPEDLSVDETIDMHDILEDELDGWGVDRSSSSYYGVYPQYGYGYSQPSPYPYYSSYMPTGYASPYTFSNAYGSYPNYGPGFNYGGYPGGYGGGFGATAYGGYGGYPSGGGYSGLYGYPSYGGYPNYGQGYSYLDGPPAPYNIRW